MRPLKSAALAGMACSLVLALPARASSVSYYLDQSNALANGTNYLQVQVSDGANGAIDFTVQVLGALGSLAADNFGIQSFAFNVVPGGSAEAANITGLADGWRASDSSRMDGFGFFDIQLQGRGNARLDTLTFSITGIDGDRPEDYAIFSTGNAAGGHQFFAAHVAGFQYCDDAGPDGGGGGGGCGGPAINPQVFAPQTAGNAGGKGKGKDQGKGKDGRGRNGHDSWAQAWQRDWRHGMDDHYDGDWVKDCVTSGFFAGSTAVPLPGTAWLFLAGAAGVLTRVRRRAAR